MLSSVRIRFTFVNQNSQKTLQRLYLVDIETLSTVRSVASRFLQKALGHNSFQSEVVSTSIESYDIPLLESSRIFRDNDAITVTYTASAAEQGCLIEVDNSSDDSCTEEEHRRATSSSAEGPSKRRRKRKRIRKRKRTEGTTTSDCIPTKHHRQQDRSDEIPTSSSINPNDVTSVWQCLQSTRPTSTKVNSHSLEAHQQQHVSSSRPTKRATNASSTTVTAVSEVEATTAAAAADAEYEWEPIDTSTISAALLLQTGDSIYCVLTMDEAAYGSIEHIETIEASSGQTELSLAVLLYDAQQHGYYRRCLQLPDESIQLFRLQRSHSEGCQAVPPTATATTTATATADVLDENTTESSLPSEETSNDVFFWLLAKKAQLESSAPPT